MTLAVTSLSYIRLFGVFTCRRKCYGTFDTLFLKLAGQLVGLLYIALIDKAVCVTAARAVESCPAVTAVFFCCRYVYLQSNPLSSDQSCLRKCRPSSILRYLRTGGRGKYRRRGVTATYSLPHPHPRRRFTAQGP